ncbi:MAG: GNAT family N-acetyltransferase, partial [Anaerolineae bacterium]|nr:GNAT family N-acetyltransferase [Anaerolineae bacterium]
MAVTFSAASELDFDDLVEVFNTGYAGYTVPVRLEADLMHNHINQNDIDLEASKVAWVEGQLVGVGLLARRDTRGWIGGLGVASEHRRQGIGRQLMQALLHTARELGLTQVQLEVIDDNEAAVNLYRDLGFEIVRRLHILQCVQLPQVDVTVPVEMTTVDKALEYYDVLHEVPNPWQRQRPALETLAPHLKAWLAGEAGHPDAYAIGRSAGRGISLMDVGMREGEGASLRALLA